MSWLGIGLGAGAYGLFKEVASDAQAKRVTSAIANYNPEVFTEGKYPPNQTALTYYQNTLNPALQLANSSRSASRSAMLWSNSVVTPTSMEMLGTQSYGLYTPQAQGGLSGKAKSYETPDVGEARRLCSKR